MSKNNAVDRAVPTIQAPKRTDAEKVTLTKSVTAAMQASSHWQAATDAQKAVAALGQHADGIAAKAAVVAALRAQLATAEGDLTLLRRDWRFALGHLVSTVKVFASGSADIVTSLGFQVVAHGPSDLLLAPAGLSVNTGKEHGTVTALWKKGRKRYGFVVQHATDPANAATYSAPQPSTRSKYTLGGLPSGANVYVRVAAVDPKAQTDLSPWSEWASAMAR